MNKELMFSSDQTEWETPRDFFRVLHQEFRFALDAAASRKNLLRNIITPEEDCFKVEWKARSKGGACYMNPPYGRLLPKFLKRAYEQSLAGITVVCLAPARTDTRVFHDVCKFGEVRLLRGRLTFEEDGKPRCDEDGHPMPAPFPSMVVIFGKGRWKRGIRTWEWQE